MVIPIINLGNLCVVPVLLAPRLQNTLVANPAVDSCSLETARSLQSASGLWPQDTGLDIIDWGTRMVTSTVWTIERYSYALFMGSTKEILF